MNPSTRSIVFDAEAGPRSGTLEAMTTRRFGIISALLLAFTAVDRARPAAADPPTVHAVADISQEFTFYMDGRFHRQYLKDVAASTQNWGTLSKLDLDNVNLLLLVAGNPRIPYSKASIEHVRRFVEDGGTMLLMGNGAEPMPPGQAVGSIFDGRFTTTRARKPIAGVGELEGEAIVFNGGTVLDLGPDWATLATDRDGRPVLGSRRFGKGHVILGARGLFGRKPDASDPINAAWITPMLVTRAETKPIDPRKRPRPTRAELKKDIGPLTLQFQEGTAPFADAVYDVYREVRPHLVDITGVEPSPGMIKSMLILPTGGGGFSSGVLIAIGAWWGNYPEQRYPMIELVAHEAGHSWVLPHAEPLWNEPIATWLGIETGRRLGFPEADATIARQIAKARRRDPDLTKLDPLAEDAHRDVIWGKSYFVFEELERRHGPGAMAKYFQTKRRLIERDREDYSMDDAVAVWSAAVGEDLFPWFQSLAFDVDPSRTDLETP